MRGGKEELRKGCLAMRIRDELGPLFEDEQFARTFLRRGGPAWSPSQLAMVSMLQFAEGLTDRRAADTVRGVSTSSTPSAWSWTIPGSTSPCSASFRDRLVEQGLEEQVLDRMLERVSELGMLRAGGRQRADLAGVLGSSRYG